MLVTYRVSNHKLIVADPAVLICDCHTSPVTTPTPQTVRENSKPPLLKLCPRCLGGTLQRFGHFARHPGKSKPWPVQCYQSHFTLFPSSGLRAHHRYSCHIRLVCRDKQCLISVNSQHSLNIGLNYWLSHLNQSKLSMYNFKIGIHNVNSLKYGHISLWLFYMW